MEEGDEVVVAEFELLVEKDRVLRELESECIEVYLRKVEEAANAKARLHQTVAAKEAAIATLKAGELSIHSPAILRQIVVGVEHCHLLKVLHRVRKPKETKRWKESPYKAPASEYSTPLDVLAQKVSEGRF